ncbi:acyltransferase [uncultured Dysgonomonas sp.]|uniref:acyltransferase n=1 Tax=uncultured Dysgonomonas sp. TaxID=206096 RepID=UPI00260452D1|nr:acyltransferase [uncultured Dysgonomonas sp.]
MKKNGRCSFGNQVSLVNTAKSSTLGRCNRCKLLVYSDAQLIIGNKVGMSNTTIVATKFIRIGNNVMIGGGSTIVDSDFHSLNPEFWHTPKDEIHMKSSDVIINDNVFIGMNAIILKGVNIGSNVIIAAGSVVTKDIPDFEIWGGNPAKFIRKNS